MLLPKMPEMKPPYIILETVLPDKENKISYLFKDFEAILSFTPQDDIEQFFQKIQTHLNKGFWLAGYFTYEFGYFLDPALKKMRPKGNQTLAWLTVCNQPCSFSGLKQGIFPDYKIQNIRPDITFKKYSKTIAKIKQYLMSGDTYQVNQTFKIKFNFQGDSFSLYQTLKNSQPTAYSAYINTGKQQIISLSPELFFKIEKGKIWSRPMKGTFSRGLTWEEDQANKQELKANKKIRAENLMITDLLRNDLGRICRQVKTSRLFEIETYPSLHQMTSTISGKLKKKTTIKEIFTALFPCGSITGAPKIATMKIIKDLEPNPRNIYCGAIGFISPKNTACFNVAIRSALIKGKKGELGVGGGIVYDSNPKTEYQEACLKAKFFSRPAEKFSLIETMLWQKGKGIFLLDLHLTRLKNSAQYFAIPINIEKIKHQLKKTCASLKTPSKIRLQPSNDAGSLSIEIFKLEDNTKPLKIKLSNQRLNPQNIFLYHKTTNRKLYDKELALAKQEGFDEVIFLNKKQQVCEGAISSIFIQKNNKLYTPPVSCGLLPGILRQHLLNKSKAQEKILYLKDLKTADKLFIGNSVRGLVEVNI